MELGTAMTWALNQKEEPFITIEVKNPRTHISRERALYTDYEIDVKTNNIAFSKTESCVRRRYSDFQWLRRRLTTCYKWVVSPPELPPKRLFGRFKRQFLKHRQQGLQRFLEGIVKQNSYLSDVALHLFLQSDFEIREIEKHLNGTDSGGEIVDALESPGRACKNKGLCRSMSHIPWVPVEKELNTEHDSGYCYSTTSSANDLLYASMGKTMERDESRYYMSLPADLNKVTKQTVSIDRGMNGSEMEKRLPLYPAQPMLYRTNSHSSVSTGFEYSDAVSDYDFSVSEEYDADDEYDLYFDHVLHCSEPPSICNRSSSVTLSERITQLPRSKPSYAPMETSWAIQKNMELLRSRRPVSERAMDSDDSDDCFHESEYDVIDSGDNIDDVMELPKSTALTRCQSYSGTKSKRKISMSSSQNESSSKPGRKKSKFRSLQNISAAVSRKPLSGSLSYRSGNAKHFPLDLERRLLQRSFFLNGDDSSYGVSVPRTIRSGEDSAIPVTSDPDSYRICGMDTFDSTLDTAAESNPERTLSRKVKLNFAKASPEKVVKGRFRISAVTEDSCIFKPEALRDLLQCRELKATQIMSEDKSINYHGDDGKNLMMPFSFHGFEENECDRTASGEDYRQTAAVPEDVITAVNALLDSVSCGTESRSATGDKRKMEVLATLFGGNQGHAGLEGAGTELVSDDSNYGTLQATLSCQSDINEKHCEDFTYVASSVLTPASVIELNTYEVIADIPVTCNLDEYCILDNRRTPVHC